MVFKFNLQDNGCSAPVTRKKDVNIQDYLKFVSRGVRMAVKYYTDPQDAKMVFSFSVVRKQITFDLYTICTTPKEVILKMKKRLERRERE